VPEQLVDARPGVPLHVEEEHGAVLILLNGFSRNFRTKLTNSGTDVLFFGNICAYHSLDLVIFTLGTTTGF
jgi:hypothetical protein